MYLNSQIVLEEIWESGNVTRVAKGTDRYQYLQNTINNKNIVTSLLQQIHLLIYILMLE